jgi:hypothetical protein
MRTHVFMSVILILALSFALSDHRARASVSGNVNVSVDYVAELRIAGATEPYRFNISIEPVMFRLQTVASRYRLVRLRVSNPTPAPVVLSSDADRLEVVPQSGPSVRALLKPQQADPAFWDGLSPEVRETLAYPELLKGTPAPAAGARPEVPESVYIYVLVPADVNQAPRSFRYTIASLNQTIVLDTRRAAAA